MNCFGEMEFNQDASQSQENFSDASFENINDEDEREPYLILVVHGIGSNNETQKLNKLNLDDCIKEVVKQGLVTPIYKYESVMVDWKSMTDQSESRQRSRKCYISSSVNDKRESFNLVAPDIIQYLNKDFGNKIRATVIEQMNEAYRKM